MSQRIEDYAVIGDLHSAALLGLDGSIDWLCLPHFDSPACFARLLGDEEHGYWKITPAGGPSAILATRRWYRPDTLVVETEYDTATGTVRVTDCMPVREGHPHLVRSIEGVSGQVDMRMELAVRFDYGEVVPWVTSHDGLTRLTAGPDSLALWHRVEAVGEDLRTVADFTVNENQRFPFTLVWHPSHEEPPPPLDSYYAVHLTEAYWTEWASQCCYQGPYKEAVVRSLITLKALTYNPTGGIVAATTTSLPEALGGNRNWDYRYCWLRDATLTLESLISGGYHAEALAWRDWLLRAVAGDVAKLQIMYGPGGERRLDEWEADWLPGYENSAPVRIGNAASGQYQLDVYGEVMSALYSSARTEGMQSRASWGLQKQLVAFLEKGWKEPDDGIWEVRGPRRHFTHSKVMAWVAVDRAVRTMEEWPDLEGPLEAWRALRDDIFNEVCTKGYNKKVGAFTQYYGSDLLDASVLMIPLVGFLPPGDPRVVSTVEAVQRDLMDHGFVLRYRTQDDGSVDGLTGREGAFLACSFWLVDCLHMIGRAEEAEELFERLLALRNDLGLLAEEYDPLAGRLVGNFPQAFSHVSLINSAFRLSGSDPLSFADDGSRVLVDNTLTTATIGRIERLGRVAVKRRSGAGTLSADHHHGGRAHRHGEAGLHRHDPATGDAVPAVPPPRRIAPGVLEIDTLLGGWERVTAGYLVEGPAPVLIETGSQSSVPVLLAALDQIGVGPSELAGVAVTHIHLDHAGGVGDVARAFPAATVYVHEKGARHLADPTRLVDSAARVYGPLLDSLYGRLDPTPPERLHVLGDGEEVDVGAGRTLVAVDSPGHAKHHLGLHDSLSGVLFAGDAVGVKLPDGGVLRPATPPPDFDLDQALTSLASFAARRPSAIALAHYGLLEQPEALLAEADETLRLWAETAETAYRQGADIAAALAARFDPAIGDVDPAQREKLDTLNGVHSNAAGFRRWLDGRAAASSG